jgi:predicted acyltransferase
MAEQPVFAEQQKESADSPPAAKPPRQESLDALRGWALLGMALSGLLPYGTLPPWMYHAQVPPPDMKFDPSISGITWVDLVFPFFLFSMGAAMPFAMGRRLDEGEPWQATLFGLFKRSALLLVFAYLVHATRPGMMDGKETFFIQLLGMGFFVGTLLLFIHSSRWSWQVNWVLKAVGVGIILVASTLVPDPTKLDPMNQDIIIKVLAGVSFTGGLVYWASRRYAWAPYAVGCLVIVVWPLIKYWPPFNPALQWTFSPLVTRLDYHKYLLIVIPGILYGIWLAKGGKIEFTKKEAGVLVFCLALLPLCLILAGRGSDAVLAGYLQLLAWGAAYVLPKESMLWQVIPSANILIFLGLMISHWGENLRKDSATVSYFLITSGLAILFHQGLELWRKRIPKESPGFMALVGSNPLLGYLLITHFIFSFVRLTGIDGWIGSQGWNPWFLAFYSLLQTLTIGVLAAWATKQKVFMRA